MATIITRANKGSPLTHAEVDANFLNLNSTKLEASDIGTIAPQNANEVAITGGAIDGTTVGATTRAAGSFTTVNANAGILSSSASAGVGYTTGGGGTVTQLTSKATGVTLNRPSGRITMNAAALAAATTVSFTLTNTAIAVDDVVVVSIASGATAGAYAAQVQATAAGSCSIALRNNSTGSLSQAVVLNFAVIKGATA